MSAPVESSPGGNPVGNGTAPAFIALVTGAIAMGISPIFVRWADVGPLTSAFWRVALGLPALYLWMRMSERDLAPQKRIATRDAQRCGLRRGQPSEEDSRVEVRELLGRLLY